MGKSDSDMKGEIGIDIAKKVEELREIFPQAFSDGEFDCRKLKQILGESEVSDSEEKYNFTWAGRRKAYELIREQTTKALKPDKEESVDFEVTENIFIEGENLETLKILQKAYYGKVKMIYIDPPYNTGDDKVYKDSFQESKKEYEKRTGQRDEQGKLISNPESDGRYHSNWLTMMYPRLFLARNLLQKDGIIFVSIDDNEAYNLRKIMNEIFGEENFLAQLIWDLRTGTAAGHFTRSHEYIMAFAKNKEELPNFEYSGDEDVIRERAIKKISDKNPATEITFPAGMKFEGGDAVFEGEIGKSEKINIVDDKMEFKNGELAHDVTLSAGWAMKNQILSWISGEETYDTKGQKIKRFLFNENGRLDYEKVRGKINPKTVIKDVGSTKAGTSELESLFEESLYDFPKPSELIRKLIDWVTTPEGNPIIMDFFAGTSTTEHAAQKQNFSDGSQRSFIMVQLPEKVDEDSDASIQGYNDIAEVGKERIRRVINELRNKKQSSSDEENDIDLGFKVFKLVDSNIKKWQPPSEEEELKKQMKLQTDPVKSDSSRKDVLYEILLKEGFTPNAEMEKKEVENKTFFKVQEDGMELFITFGDEVTQDLVESLNIGEETTLVCFDSALTDTNKDNISRICNLKTI